MTSRKNDRTAQGGIAVSAPEPNRACCPANGALVGHPELYSFVQLHPGLRGAKQVYRTFCLLKTFNRQFNPCPTRRFAKSKLYRHSGTQSEGMDPLTSSHMHM